MPSREYGIDLGLWGEKISFRLWRRLLHQTLKDALVGMPIPFEQGGNYALQLFLGAAASPDHFRPDHRQSVIGGLDGHLAHLLAGQVLDELLPLFEYRGKDRVLHFRLALPLDSLEIHFSENTGQSLRVCPGNAEGDDGLGVSQRSLKTLAQLSDTSG